jgi:hypothetical protein
MQLLFHLQTAVNDSFIVIVHYGPLAQLVRAVGS